MNVSRHGAHEPNVAHASSLNSFCTCQLVSSLIASLQACPSLLRILGDPKLKLWMESNLVIEIHFTESTLLAFKLPALFNSSNAQIRKKESPLIERMKDWFKNK